MTKGGATRWPKGVSGNPGGRPRAHSPELRAAFTAKGHDALLILSKIMDDESSRAADRIAAAKEILAMGLSRPAPERPSTDTGGDEMTEFFARAEALARSVVEQKQSDTEVT